MLCRLSTIWPRLRARIALRGTVVAQAVSSAQAAQVRCEAPQMPHARGVTTRPACGSLSRKMISKPRNNSAEVHALVTTPFSISTRTSRSPSTRPTGEMSSVCTGIARFPVCLAASDHEHVLFGPGRSSILGGSRQRDVATFVDALWQVLRHAHHGLCLEHRTRRQIKERELRLGAAQAGHSRPSLRGLAVPQDAVARRVSHRAAAAQVVEQAAFALTEFGCRDLVGEMHVAGAAGLR